MRAEICKATGFAASPEHRHGVQVDELIRMVDHDGDGQVSYEEFRKMVQDFNKKEGGK